MEIQIDSLDNGRSRKYSNGDYRPNSKRAWQAIGIYFCATLILEHTILHDNWQFNFDVSILSGVDQILHECRYAQNDNI